MAQGQKLYKEMGRQLRDPREDRILVKEVLSAEDEAEAVAQLAAGGFKPPFRYASFLAEVLQYKHLAEARNKFVATQ